MCLNGSAGGGRVQAIDTVPSANPASVLGAMIHLASACSIVASADGAERSGATVTAVCAVTADPPRLLVCIAREMPVHALIVDSGTLSINVLSEAQQGLARRFADKTGDDNVFREDEWSTGRLGAPVLREALASFDCRVVEVIPAGTQTIFICDVVDVAVGAGQVPLIVFNRAFVAVAVCDQVEQSGGARRSDE